eukprot:GFUD01004810.1.p1 GENE.GFUD01004810.1~~GFUD01004810.1.p1  ORF type:complete len:120 (+),score=25.42 GFUD01004810.1:60-419(+)
MFSSAFLLLFLTGFANSCCTPPMKCITSRFQDPPVDMLTRNAMTYRRPTEGCAEIEQVLIMAVKLCPHGSDGFRLEEVENCTAQLSRYGVLRGRYDFEMMDENGDEELTIEEWRKFEGC